MKTQGNRVSLWELCPSLGLGHRLTRLRPRERGCPDAADIP
ncbi:hypothetical protein EBBID32_30650 [Sphingobium indicum BiD32]|uniref:Uncharacterized protein n=1 Tax=Sphingobium indicum BiD32 TaxID=1301087 RepID=N1MNC6_9SPHN|nr:hypothetical protein EBBID32_30650 [Sphingobium indicum BiD32]